MSLCATSASASTELASIGGVEVLVEDGNEESTHCVDTARKNEACSTAPPKNGAEITERNRMNPNENILSASSSSLFVDDHCCSSSSHHEQQDTKSCCSSEDKDSGVGIGNTLSESGGGGAERVSSRSDCDSNFENTSNANSASISPSNNQVDLDPAFLWNASLLYFTGIHSPKVKEHHFLNASGLSSKSTSYLFKSRSSKSLCSNLPSGSIENISGMDSYNNTRGTPPRWFSRRGKTLPATGLDSSTGTPTPDSGFLSGSSRGSTLLSSLSSLRKRHASCHAPSSGSSGMISDGYRARKSSGSMATPPRTMSPYSFNSLPRSPRDRLTEEEGADAASAGIEMSGSSSTLATASQLSRSSSGFKSAKKALRNSFKAAKSFFPTSPSKVSPVNTIKGKSCLKGDNKNIEVIMTDDNLAVENYSAPNTPSVIKQSRLERVRKRFNSTLSLHVDAADSRRKSSSASAGIPPSRSKSVSILAGDSLYRHEPNASADESLHAYRSFEGDHANVTNITENVKVETGYMADDNNSSSKSESKEERRGSKSLFRFISKSKTSSKERKSDDTFQNNSRGFDDAAAEPLSLQKEDQGELGKGQQSSPEACIQQHQVKETTQEEGKGETCMVATASAEPKEKKKKRVTMMKNIVGKAIFGKNDKKMDNDVKNNTNVESAKFYKSAGGGEMPNTTSSDKKKEAKSQWAVSQEIVSFANEPRVRTPKSNQRQGSKSAKSGNASNSKVASSTPSSLATAASYSEKDCEVQELEVCETSIDISPLKTTQQLTQPSSYYDTKSNISYNKKSTVLSADVKLPSDSKVSSDRKKSTKSKTFLTSRPISLFPSSPPLENSTMGGSNKKKNKNLKTANMKLSQEVKTSPEKKTQNVPLYPPLSSLVTEEKQDATSVEQEVTNNNNDISSPSSETRHMSQNDKDVLSNTSESATSDQSNNEIKKILSENVTEDEEKFLKRLSFSSANTDDPDTACTESFRQLMPFNYELEPIEEGKKERLYKVLVVGELGAGKTSIIKRYVHQFFSQHYRATIGVDFALKVLRWDPDTVVRLQLWDIAGQERFGSMTRVYYKEAVGAFVVFDVTRSATLEAVPKWKADLDAKVALPDGRPIPTVLLANKSDQPKEGIAANREKMNDFCQQQGFSAWFETSAKDNINIDESANFLVSKILEMDKWSQEPLAADPDKVELTANGKHKGSSSSNCAC